MPAGRPTHSEGVSILGFALLMPVVAIVILVCTFGVYEGRKAYWDHQIRKLCASDGGGRVLQSIELSREEYGRLTNNFGKFAIPIDSEALDSAPIVQRRTSTYIHR